MKKASKSRQALAPRAGAKPGKTDQSIEIEGELNIYSVAEWHSRITAAFEDTASHCAVIDLSRVSEIDTAGVQLLLMARRSAAAQGRTLQFVAPSSAVRELVQLCLLEGLVEDAVAEGGERAGEEVA